MKTYFFYYTIKGEGCVTPEKFESDEKALKYGKDSVFYKSNGLYQIENITTGEVIYNV